MKSKLTFILSIILFVFLSTNISFSQSLFKINSGIGGSSTINTTISDNNDNTMLYVIGGAVIAGVIVYALLNDKKEEAKEDTTSSSYNLPGLDKRLVINDKVDKQTIDIPVNIFLGMKNDLIKREDKRYYLGLSYNF
jgi:hypothetical protein